MIVINYETNITGSIKTSGYAYPFITEYTLRKTLPFLTYINILNYRITIEGDIIDIDDTAVIDMAISYGVAPILFLSTLSSQGVGSMEVTNAVLTDENVQNHLFDNLIRIIESKGFYGINIYLQYINEFNTPLYESLIKRLSEQLKRRELLLFVTITPQINIERTEIDYPNINYSIIGSYADSVILVSYDWAYSYGPPEAATPLNIIQSIVESVTNIILKDKVLLGIQVIGYDWELPYIPTYTLGRSITFDLAIALALNTGSSIQYDEISQDPYFFYINENGRLHLVWFQDARSVNSMTQLVMEKNLQGLSIWNLMRFFNQMWLIINYQFEIEKIDLKR